MEASCGEGHLEVRHAHLPQHQPNLLHTGTSCRGAEHMEIYGEIESGWRRASVKKRKASSRKNGVPPKKANAWKKVVTSRIAVVRTLKSRGGTIGDLVVKISLIEPRMSNTTPTTRGAIVSALDPAI